MSGGVRDTFYYDVVGSQSWKGDAYAKFHEKMAKAIEHLKGEFGSVRTGRATPNLVEKLKAEARSRGLWNLFLPHETEWSGGLSNIEISSQRSATFDRLNSSTHG